MCNPIAIGLMVAGTALQMNAQQRRQAAMQDAAKEQRFLENQRQQKYSEERSKELLASQAGMGVEAQDQALQEAAAKRESTYSGAAIPERTETYNTAADNGAPRIVMEDAEKKRSAAAEEVAQLGDARARLGAYGDVGLANRITNSDFANRMGMLGGFARGSAALLPGEVQAAMQNKAGKGRGQELLGTALSMYGAAGAPAMFGGAAAGAGAYGTGLSTGAAGNLVNSGAASTLGATAPGAGNALAGGNIAATLFPTAAQTAAQANAPVAGAGLGGLFSDSAPLFGSTAAKGYLPSWMNPRRGSI